MKRITYISRLKHSLSLTEIEAIGKSAGINNRKEEITGILLYFNNLFFQIIEGEDNAINNLFDIIKQDERHQDVLCLKSEENVTERYFPEWEMKLVNLDGRNDELSRPVKLLLQALLDSHTIVEKYTQSSVLKIISRGLNPLNTAPKQIERVILFGDIFSYTYMSEELNVEDVFLVINTYFEICTRIITEKGGEVNKYIGDGLMAYFDINNADGAIEACVEILDELHELRKNSTQSSPLKLLYSGFGMAQGKVLEGNMGSDIKMDYTIIGDAVNRASRLEGHTRVVEKALVIAEDVKNNCKKEWDFLRLGQFFLKGNKGHTAVYTVNTLPASHFNDSDQLTQRINNLVELRYHKKKSV